MDIKSRSHLVDAIIQPNYQAKNIPHMGDVVQGHYKDSEITGITWSSRQAWAPQLNPGGLITHHFHSMNFFLLVAMVYFWTLHWGSDGARYTTPL